MTILTAVATYQVAVPADIFQQAEEALGEMFNGTVNQLDTWVKENLPGRALEYLDSHKQVNEHPEKFIWTAYLTTTKSTEPRGEAKAPNFLLAAISSIAGAIASELQEYIEQGRAYLLEFRASQWAKDTQEALALLGTKDAKGRTWTKKRIIKQLWQFSDYEKGLAHWRRMGLPV